MLSVIKIVELVSVVAAIWFVFFGFWIASISALFLAVVCYDTGKDLEYSRAHHIDPLPRSIGRRLDTDDDEDS
jgi:hypothetical protein